MDGLGTTMLIVWGLCVWIGDYVCMDWGLCEHRVKWVATWMPTSVYLQEGGEFLERDSKRPKFQLQEDEEEKQEEEAATTAGQSMVASN